jgi:hypothetical protein
VLDRLHITEARTCPRLPGGKARASNGCELRSHAGRPEMGNVRTIGRRDTCQPS